MPTDIAASNRFLMKMRRAAGPREIIAELEGELRRIAAPALLAILSFDDELTGWSEAVVQIGVPPDDPLRASMLHLQTGDGSPPLPASETLRRLAGLGAEQLIPLICRDEPLGAVALSSDAPLDDATLRELEQVAALAAAAWRMARMVEQRDIADGAWRDTEEELRIAQTIQRSLLPESLPEIPGWRFDAHYQPARVVGGDLYDFIELPGDLLGVIFGDASDKSIPAALVMATARTLVRAAAQRLVLPGQTLATANDDLCAQIPPGMFVTCFMAILESSTGRLRYANAGHCAPFLRTHDGVVELRASGWPLGMMPGRRYDEEEVVLEPGMTLVCYSDGLSESRNAAGEMIDAARVQTSLLTADSGESPLPAIREAHRAFTGDAWAQDDDLTLLSITRQPIDQPPPLLARFDTPSAPDIEREVADKVLAASASVPLSAMQCDRLHTAVAEAVMNAAEHGNQFRADLPVAIEVLGDERRLIVRIADRGVGGPVPSPDEPDLAAKLDGRQSPRGWGLFLIERMVDHMALSSRPDGHVIQLTFDVQTDAQRDEETLIP